jgi:hypothetical protein
MGAYDRPLSVFALSRTTKIPMARIRFLVDRYEVAADGEDDQGRPLYWMRDVKEVSEQHERVVAAARADWVRRHPPVRY